MDKHARQLYHEKQWLASIVKEPSRWEEKTIDVDHFQNKHNRQMYKLIERCLESGKPLDTSTWITLSDADQKQVGGVDYIKEIEKHYVPFDDQMKLLETDLHAFKVANQIIDEVKTLPDADYYSLEDLRSISERITQSVEGVREKRKDFKTLLRETKEKAMSQTDGMSGIATGYPSLDAAFDGWQLKDLILIGARPSIGKTAVTINFMLHSAVKGYIPTYIPAETGDESIAKRAIAILGNLPVNAMRHPTKHLTATQLGTYHRTVERLEKMPIHIEGLQDIREIKQLMRERTKQHPDGKHLLIIDHLAHLHDGETYQNRTIQYEEYCKKLKDLAKQYNVAVMLLSQLSREVEKRQDHRPMMSDLRDSGAIEQIADVIAFLYREAYYNRDEAPSQQELEIIIAKNRDGGTGTVKLEFIPETNRLVEART